MNAYHEQSPAKLARNLAPDLVRLPEYRAARTWEEDRRAALLVVVIERVEQEREGR